MRLISIFTLLLCMHSTFAQIDFEGKDLVVIDEITGQLTIESYDNLQLFKGEKCKFPKGSVEDLFCRFFNIKTTEELEQYFKPNDIPTSYRGKDYLKDMKLYDNKKNYYHLDSKYIFDDGVAKDIFIKYINYNETFPKPIYSIFYVQSYLNTFKVKDMGENLDTALFLIGTNTNQVTKYFENMKSIDVSSAFDKFLKSIKNKDFNDEAFSLKDEKYSPFYDGNEKNTIEKGKIITTTFKYKKTFHNTINGVTFKEKILSKEEISLEYKIPIELLKKDSLTLKEVISVSISNNNYTIIKLDEQEPIVILEHNILNRNIINDNNTLFVLSKIDFEVFVDICFSDDIKKSKFRSMIEENNKIMMPKLREIVEKNKNIF